MQPDPEDPADPQREHGSLVLEVSELALDRAALVVEVLVPLGLARDQRILSHLYEVPTGTPRHADQGIASPAPCQGGNVGDSGVYGN